MNFNSVFEELNKFYEEAPKAEKACKKDLPAKTPELKEAANIPSRFSYKTGDVYSDREGIFRCHDTWDKVKWFKFNHLLIGKPERIIIYRINKKYVNTIVKNTTILFSVRSYAFLQRFDK